MIISLAQLMVVLDATIVNIALPHIKADLGFGQANLSWVVNAYTLAFGSLLLLGGRAGDLLGRRKVFVSGVVVFALASLIGGLAQDQTTLISARVLQGLGAAVASPTALSLITTTFPAGQARNRAFAVYAAMSGAGAAVGLILGGALTEVNWRWTFFINVPIGLAVVVLAPRFLGESRRQRGRFDLPGAITATAGLVGLVYGLTHAATHGWSDGVTVGWLAAGVAVLGLFLLIEARSAHALMPFRVLAHRDRGTSYLVMLAVGAAMFSMFYFLGIYIQEVLGYSSLQAGVAFLPFSAAIVVAAQIASLLAGRIDPRWIAGAGGLLAAAGMWWMAQTDTDVELPRRAARADRRPGPRDRAGLRSADPDRGRRGAQARTPASRRRCSTPCSRSAARSVWRRSAPWRPRPATDRGRTLGAALQQQVAVRPGRQGPLPALRKAIEHDAFTQGATSAFIVGSLIMAAATVIILLFLRVRHQTLSTDGVHLSGH